MAWNTPFPAAAAVRGSARGEEDVAVEAEEVVGAEAAQVIGPGATSSRGDPARPGTNAVMKSMSPAL